MHFITIIKPQQWGYFDTPKEGAYYVSLPISFKNRAFSNAGIWGNPDNPPITVDTSDVTIAIRADKNNVIIGRNGTGTRGIYYIVIGC